MKPFDMLLEALGNFISFKDPILTILLFFFLSSLSYFMIKKYKKKPMMSWVLALSFIGLVAYVPSKFIHKSANGDSTNNKRITIEFRTVKKAYRRSELIGFIIKVNRDGYYYLHTRKAGTDRFIPLGVKNNRLIANKEIATGTHYRVKTFVGNERVRLLVCTQKRDNFKKPQTEVSYSKELEYIESQNSNSSDQNVSCAVAELTIPIINENSKIDTPEETKPQVSLTQQENPLEEVLEDREYSLNEEVDISITCNQAGYVHIFELTKTQRVLSNEKRESYGENAVKTYVTAHRPLGRHVIVAICTKEDENIQNRDFKLHETFIKGEPYYSVTFDNGKKYLYSTDWFDVVE